ncbi:MAG: hypothetical protein ABSF92_07640 [Candidatus Acidiferrales bacterium]|jgi:hypothetical protein
MSAWVLGDFCLEEKCRSLGPALQLQRACLEAVASPFEFCYDFPSKSMMAVYKRLGVQQIGTLVRWAKPLRVDRQIEKVVRSRIVARGLGAVASVALTRLGWKGERSACELVLHEGSCGEEFSVLDQQLRTQLGVRTVCAAEFLNWRYHAQPNTAHQILKAYRAGTLIGYVIFTRVAADGMIEDMLSVEEPAVIARLLNGAVDLLRQRGVRTVSLNAGDAHPWSGVFARAGFRRREGAPIVVYTRPGGSISLSAFQRDWCVMKNERDS